MAAAISKELGIEAELIQGKGGVFDVTVNDEIVFSKKKVHRFPEHEEILSRLRR
ncbi:MAG: SelT/SelW/SelH family protein [Desulfobacteraceae bacterium]|nr:MAG: SelT/SelW/SelH family protein [Desulfobacteraceae bacterium]